MNAMPLLSSPAATLCAWLLTYAAHSTILLTLAWILTRWLPQHGHAVRESLWKAALVGGIITASMQVALGSAPGGGVGVMPDQEAHRLLEAPDPAVPLRKQPSPVPCPVPAKPTLLPYPDHASASEAARRRESTESDQALVPLALGSTSEPPGRSPTWMVVALVVWGVASGVLAARVWLRRRRLWTALADRQVIVDGPLPAMMRRLCRAARIRSIPRLTVSGRIAGPMAVTRGEICLPRRALRELGEPEQEGMLAHELAHIVRGDHRWLQFAATLESFLFFQPLNRLARRRVQESSEYLCDAWAVGRTGGDVALARCLAEVAGWITRPAPHVVPGMAPPGSSLVRRVHQLLATDSSMGRTWPRGVRIGVFVAVVTLGTWCAPGVVPRANHHVPSRHIEILEHGRILLMPQKGHVLVAGTGRIQLRDGGRVVAIPSGCSVALDGSPVTSRVLAGPGRDVRVLGAEGGPSWTVRSFPCETTPTEHERSKLARRGFVLEIVDGRLQSASCHGRPVSDHQVCRVDDDTTWLLDGHGRPCVDILGGSLAPPFRRPAAAPVSVGFSAIGVSPGHWGEKKIKAKGLLVRAVVPGGPAAHSDLRPYDLITDACGKRIKTSADLRWVLTRKKAGDALRLRVRRGGESRILWMTLAPPDRELRLREAAARVCLAARWRTHGRVSELRVAVGEGRPGARFELGEARDALEEVAHAVQLRVGVGLWESLSRTPEATMF